MCCRKIDSLEVKNCQKHNYFIKALTLNKASDAISLEFILYGEIVQNMWAHKFKGSRLT
jgi:hypothetical protein